MGAEELHKWIEILFFDAMAKEELRLDLQVLRKTNKHLFWNLIYYFNEF